LPLEVAQQLVAAGPHREVVVDEHQVAGADRASRSQAGQPLDRRILLLLAGGDRLAAADLVEVLDGHGLAVDLEAEVAGLETGDPVPLAIGDHRLDVDHPHLDLLPEDARGLRGRRRLLRRGRDQGCEQGRQRQPEGTERSHGFLHIV
jgi:hypothetical protein